MGKEIFVLPRTFRAYFGKCFTNIVLGDRIYGLKQETEEKEKKVLHTYKHTTSVVDPLTGKTKSEHKIAGYYANEKYNVNTGKLTEEQKTLLKQQFLQLAYDSVSENRTSNKLYAELTYNPNSHTNLPIEAEYKSGQENGNYNIAVDYSKKEKEYWKKIENTPYKNMRKEFEIQPQEMDLYYDNGKEVNKYLFENVNLRPNYAYRNDIANTVNSNWSNIYKSVYSNDQYFSVDDYFNALYKSVLDNMEKEDRELIERECPNFGITEKEKELFSARNTKLQKHFDSLDPVAVGNKYVKKIYPEGDKAYIPFASDTLRKYFPKTISTGLVNVKEIPHEVKETYKAELNAFVNDLLNAPKSQEEDAVNLKRIAFIFDINKKNIKTGKDVGEFIDKINTQLMPALVLSQNEDTKINPNGIVTSNTLNKLICTPEANKELTHAVSSVTSDFHKVADRNKAIYDEFITPNLNKDGILDLKKLQDTWLDLANKMDEPTADSDSQGLKIVKGHKNAYKKLEVFNGEKKEVNAEFKSLEAKTEWRNEEVMGILKEALRFYGTDEIISQVNNADFRFGMKTDEYTKRMYATWKDTDIANASLSRIKNLGGRAITNEVKLYKNLEKDNNGFVKIPKEDEDYDNTREHYLNHCANEIKFLQDSYNKRSIFYRWAFWKTKPEKEAIKQIRKSLTENGFKDKQINNAVASIKKSPIVDGPFNYKVINDLVDEKIVKDVEEVQEFSVEELKNPEENKLKEKDLEIDAADLKLEKAKILTQYILPKNNITVIDPILGNVSEQYGVILNREQIDFMSEYDLEQHAKNLSQEQPLKQPKQLTEKDVEIWEDDITGKEEIDKKVSKNNKEKDLSNKKLQNPAKKQSKSPAIEEVDDDDFEFEKDEEDLDDNFTVVNEFDYDNMNLDNNEREEVGDELSNLRDNLMDKSAKSKVVQEEELSNKERTLDK